MSFDQIIPSLLHVTASSDLDVSHDLLASENHTIGQLLDEEANKNQENTKTEENQNPQEQEIIKQG